MPFFAVLNIYFLEALSEEERADLRFLSEFESKFLTQGILGFASFSPSEQPVLSDRYENRTIFDSLNLGWECCMIYPEKSLTKIDEKVRSFFRNRQLRTYLFEINVRAPVFKVLSNRCQLQTS